MSSKSLPSDPVAVRILSNARRHFMAHGFKNVTMDELASEMGMSKKTLYAHFPSKSALVKSVLTQKLDEAERELGDVVIAEKSDDFVAALHQLTAHLQRRPAEAQPMFVRNLSREEQALAEYLIERRGKRDLRKNVRQTSYLRTEAGHVRKDIPIEFLIEILLAVLDTITGAQSTSRPTTCRWHNA